MIYHVTIAREGRRALFDTELAQRTAVRALCRSYGAALLLYCIVDDHCHAVVRGTRSEVGRKTSGFQQALRRAHAPGGDAGRFTEPARVRPVRSRDHLERLVAYVIGQPARHELTTSPARWWGSCFQDLVGARVVRHFDARTIRRELPRLRDADIWAAAGLRPLQPLPVERLLEFGPRELVRAAADVYFVAPDLQGRRPEVNRARNLVLGMLRSTGATTRQIAAIVGCSERTARKHREPHPAALNAALLQLAILASSPAPDPRLPHARQATRP